MTTPTPESTERARKWRVANTEIIERVNGSSYLKWNRSPEEFDSDLALEFDRVRLEGKIELIGEMERSKYESMRLGGPFRFNSDWLPIIQKQLSALNQPAGEKEGK